MNEYSLAKVQIIICFIFLPFLFRFVCRFLYYLFCQLPDRFYIYRRTIQAKHYTERGFFFSFPSITVW